MEQQQGVELLAACTQYFTEAFQFNLTLYAIAKWAFILAIALAVISTLLDLLIKYRSSLSANSPENLEIQGVRDVGATEAMKAFAGLIDSLVKAPVWFFIFTLGIALIWVAEVDVPEFCVEPLADITNVEPVPVK